MFETFFNLLGEATRNLAAASAAAGGPGDRPPPRDIYASDDDLPAEARELIAAAEQAAEAARARLQAAAARVRAAAEDEIRAARRRADDAVRDLEVAAARDLAPVFRTLFDGLRAVQEDYARRGLLDEALAVRANLRQLRAEFLGVRPDPGTLGDVPDGDDGRSFLYEVAGRTDGSVWGSNPYTLDSHLGTAAVHAGLVKPGLRAVVKLTVLAGEFRAFVGTPAGGVTTSEYHGSTRAFRLDPAA